MQTRHAVTLVVIVAILALALGTTMGYSISNEQTVTTRQIQTVTGTSSVVILQSVTTTVTTPLTEITTNNLTVTTIDIPYVPIGTQFSMSENSSIEVFVRYYYYDADKTVTISPSNTSMLYIWGGNYSGDVSNTNPNFTISELSPTSPLTIGGASNESEGAIVAYEIHSALNSNGSYDLGVNHLFPEVCAVEFPLIVGNGNPNYTSKIFGGCIVYAVVPSDEYTATTSGFGNLLLAEVVGIDG